MRSVLGVVEGRGVRFEGWYQTTASRLGCHGAITTAAVME
jgi:hypothetical protein